MDNQNWKGKWELELFRARKRVLFWDRPFLPKPPHIIHLTEESVVLYLKKINPQLRRADNRFLRLIDWVLYDLVFGGLVVLAGFGVPWGLYSLVSFLSTMLPRIDPMLFLRWGWKGILYLSAVLTFFLWLKLVGIWWDRLWDKTQPHPVEMVKQVLNMFI